MIKLPFDVNDESLRKDFLETTLFSALEHLSADDRPSWGKMTSLQMVEHLLWAMEIANGTVTVECNLHPKLIERFKSFLHNDMSTRHEFMNPLLKDGLPLARFINIRDAIAELRDQTRIFLSQTPADWKVPREHPVFGPLHHEEWSRAHFKHYYHHLLQFGLITIDQQ